MNDNKAVDFEAAHQTLDAVGLIEIVDADGNPTGQYRVGAEETVYVAEDHPDHSVTTH